MLPGLPRHGLAALPPPPYMSFIAINLSMRVLQASTVTQLPAATGPGPLRPLSPSRPPPFVPVACITSQIHREIDAPSLQSRPSPGTALAVPVPSSPGPLPAFRRRTSSLQPNTVACPVRPRAPEPPLGTRVPPLPPADPPVTMRCRRCGRLCAGSGLTGHVAGVCMSAGECCASGPFACRSPP